VDAQAGLEKWNQRNDWSVGGINMDLGGGMLDFLACQVPKSWLLMPKDCDGPKNAGRDRASHRDAGYISL